MQKNIQQLISNFHSKIIKSINFVCSQNKLISGHYIFDRHIDLI